MQGINSKSMRAHVAVVGLCQIRHNDFCVSFSSHGARIQKRSLIRHTAAKNEEIHTNMSHSEELFWKNTLLNNRNVTRKHNIILSGKFRQ